MTYKYKIAHEKKIVKTLKPLKPLHINTVEDK